MIPRARRSYELEVTKYQQMGQGYPAVLAAQKSVFTLQMSYVKALEAEWHSAIGLLNFALANGLDPLDATDSGALGMNTPTAAQ